MTLTAGLLGAFVASFGVGIAVGMGLRSVGLLVGWAMGRNTDLD
jgi:hypothetical protein